jgi:hypothetical protein
VDQKVQKKQVAAGDHRKCSKEYSEIDYNPKNAPVRFHSMREHMAGLIVKNFPYPNTQTGRMFLMQAK